MKEGFSEQEGIWGWRGEVYTELELDNITSTFEQKISSEGRRVGLVEPEGNWRAFETPHDPEVPDEPFEQ
jgi:hypothetical protein